MHYFAKVSHSCSDKESKNNIYEESWASLSAISLSLAAWALDMDKRALSRSFLSISSSEAETFGWENSNYYYFIIIIFKQINWGVQNVGEKGGKCRQI